MEWKNFLFETVWFNVWVFNSVFIGIWPLIKEVVIMWQLYRNCFLLLLKFLLKYGLRCANEMYGIATEVFYNEILTILNLNYKLHFCRERRWLLKVVMLPYRCSLTLRSHYTCEQVTLSQCRHQQIIRTSGRFHCNHFITLIIWVS